MDRQQFIDDHPDECIEWAGTKVNGYGVFRPKFTEVRNAATGALMQSVYVHRKTWEDFHGKPIPKGMVIRHTCDNPACYNPKHLLLGTHSDNRRDAIERGRAYRGFAEPTHPLHGKSWR